MVIASSNKHITIISNNNIISNEGKHISESSTVSRVRMEDSTISEKERLQELKKVLAEALESPTEAAAAASPPQSFIRGVMADFHRHSTLQYCRDVPQIDLKDLDRIGPVIGKGGFAIVTEVEWNGSLYAMKQLKDSVLEGDMVSIAVSDLIKEGYVLAALPHPHIVSIHAKHVDEDVPANNFLILDRLEQTLMKRMVEWRDRDDKLIQRNPKQRIAFLEERLAVCLDICHTLNYLHDNNVIYRDLKAENLGFDKDGSIKLYDFGLAKELKEGNKTETGKYRLSGNTGSLAYMAPEVAKGWKYDKRVDIYSFGILMWEICSLRHAFPGHTTAESMTRVWAGEERPPIPEWWPSELSAMMKQCWSYFAQTRPDFEAIAKTLEAIIDSDSEEELDHVRSIKSFRFGSRLSQKLSRDSATAGDSNRAATLRPHHLERKKKFLGIF